MESLLRNLALRREQKKEGAVVTERRSGGEVEDVCNLFEDGNEQSVTKASGEGENEDTHLEKSRGDTDRHRRPNRQKENWIWNTDGG